MNDEDLNLYAEILASTSTSTTATNIDGLANTFTNNTPSDTSGYIVTSGNAGNSNLNINTGYSNISAHKIEQTKEQQIEDVKDILNSVQRALDALKTQVQSLTSSIEAENELKHKRRKLGGDE